MNKELNVEEFFSLTERSSSLRLKLINDLNTLANNKSIDDSCRFHYIRSNIPTLYSQYEGFIKDIIYNIPLFLKSIDKKVNLNNSILALHISSKLFYMRDTNFLNFYDNTYSAINLFFQNDKYYFQDYNYGTLEIPHDDKLFKFLELLNFPDEAISKFKVSNQKIKTYYKRRNSIVHGSINQDDSNGLHLSDAFNENHFKKLLTLWNEQYEFTKDIINILNDSLYSWVQNELYKN